MTPWLLNEASLAKTTIIKFFMCYSGPVGTYILESTCTWWQKTTNRQTHTGQLL